jgi:hypothetical protein
VVALVGRAGSRANRKEAARNDAPIPASMLVLHIEQLTDIPQAQSIVEDVAVFVFRTRVVASGTLPSREMDRFLQSDSLAGLLFLVLVSPSSTALASMALALKEMVPWHRANQVGCCAGLLHAGTSYVALLVPDEHSRRTSMGSGDCKRLVAAPLGTE